MEAPRYVYLPARGELFSAFKTVCFPASSACSFADAWPMEIMNSLLAAGPTPCTFSSFTPALPIASRIWSSCTGSLNFTVTMVPPLKSTFKGMPCQNNIDKSPATVTTSEKPRKYHFFDIQSTFTSRNNSTLVPFQKSELDAYRLATLLTRDVRIKDDARNKH